MLEKFFTGMGIKPKFKIVSVLTIKKFQVSKVGNERWVKLVVLITESLN